MRFFPAMTLCALMSALPVWFAPTYVQSQGAPGTAQFDPLNPNEQTRVMRGETLFNIAERTRSPLQALIRVNNLAPPYALTPGQVLQLPPLKVHVVAAGESFGAIARRYSIDERSLAVFNRLPRPVTLTIGQRVILPPTVIDRFTGLEPQDLVDLLCNEIQAGREVTGSVPGQIVRNTEASSPERPAPPPPPPVPVQVAQAPASSNLPPTASPPPPSRYGPDEDSDGVIVSPAPACSTATTARARNPNGSLVTTPAQTAPAPASTALAKRY